MSVIFHMNSLEKNVGVDLTKAANGKMESSASHLCLEKEG